MRVSILDDVDKEEENEQLDELVSKRIKKSRSTGRLDLTGLNLTEFPMEIFDITNDDAPLTDLQISNNRIYRIPDEIGDLQLLERLGLAGNRLTKLPESIGKLKRLQGLWAHGNLLKSLPESICSCQSLRNLSVAGNRIQKLPENLSQLVALEELSVPGNQLVELPNLGKMFNLSDIDLHGNCIEDLSANGNDFQFLKALETFSLQGNQLKSIPGSLGNLKRLRSLNLAENRIQHVPEELRNLPVLTSVWLYSNDLRSLPKELQKSQSLRQLWIENNGNLDKSELEAFIQNMKDAKMLKTLGIDTEQALKIGGGFENMSAVSVAEVPNRSDNAGYFKLVKWDGNKSALDDSKRAPVLIVSFGSAPGVPNWGGLLKKLRKKVGENDGKSYDVLYVCDVERSWYAGNKMTGNVEEEVSKWNNRLQDICSKYSRVLYLGDSMGASASLVFAEHATRVLAFCPQVDLFAASIRPSRSANWMRLYKTLLLQGALRSEADITIHTGSWTHDVDQAAIVVHSSEKQAEQSATKRKKKIKTKMYPVNNHRLALVLSEDDTLVNVVKEAFETEYMNAISDGSDTKKNSAATLKLLGLA
jgi:Leucine-rich repeat (LRR) protein